MVKKNGKKILYKSIKIREEHYNLVKGNKEKTGINIDFFVGQAIIEKLKKEKQSTNG